MENKASRLRARILELTREFYREAHAPEAYSTGMKIPYAGRVYDDNELASLVDASLDFWLTAGRYADRFEHNLANYVGAKHALFVNSGSSANLCALSALTSPLFGARRIKAGDEVITTAAAFPTTVNPIFQNNATPVFVDTEPGTYNIDVSKLDEAVSDKTRAVMVAHTLGNPFDLDAITRFCKDHGLFLVEDCCDALGAQWGGKKVGTFGDLSTLSFYPAHHITTGEGGAVLTSGAIAKRAAESFRDWGRDCWCASGKDNTCGKRFGWQLGSLPQGYDHKYTYSHIGYNLKATDMQAAIGCAQLEKADSFVEARRKNHAFLLSRIRQYESHFILPRSLPKANPSPFGFVLTIRENAGFSRPEIVSFLEGHGIATRMIFAGNIVRQPAYKNSKFRVVGSLSGADSIMNNSFWVGVYPGLTQEMLGQIADKFDQFMKGR